MSWNPLLQAHWDLIGRRNQWLIPLVVAGVILFLTGVSYTTLADRNVGAMCSWWLGLISILQAILFLLVAPGAVRRSVLRDFQTGMIESHRLSPMSGARLVLGYLTGPLAQAGQLYAVTLLLGTGFALGVAQSMKAPGAVMYFGTVLGGWYFLQVVLATLGFAVAALGLLVALATRGKGNLVGWLIGIGVFGGSFGVALVPGLALVTGVMTGGSLINALSKGATAPTGIVATLSAMTCQFVLGLIFAASAARLVRNPERSLFSIFYGIALLLVTAAILAVGISQAGEHTWLLGRGEPGEAASVHLISSICVLVIVALFPLWAAAWEQHRLEIGRAFGADVAARRLRTVRLVPLAVALVCGASWFVFFRCTAPERLKTELEDAFLRPDRRAAMGAAIVLFVWTNACLLYWGRSRNLRPWLVVLASLLLLCVIPVGLERIMYEVLAEEGRAAPAYIPWAATVSPLGTLIACTSNVLNAQVWAGLGVQAAIAAGATGLAVLARRRANAPAARALAA